MKDKPYTLSDDDNSRLGAFTTAVLDALNRPDTNGGCDAARLDPFYEPGAARPNAPMPTDSSQPGRYYYRLEGQVDVETARWNEFRARQDMQESGLSKVASVIGMLIVAGLSLACMMLATGAAQEMGWIR